jgi:hypothetical protein
MAAENTGYQRVLDELETISTGFQQLASQTNQTNLGGIQENIATVSNPSKDQMQMLEKLKLKNESLVEELTISRETNQNLFLQNAGLKDEVSKQLSEWAKLAEEGLEGGESKNRKLFLENAWLKYEMIQIVKGIQEGLQEGEEEGEE